MTNLKTIVAFHIGRGDRFNNSGFLSFIGEEEISKFTDDLFLHFENLGDFNKRYGYDITYNKDQKCIIDLATDEEFDELEESFGITEDDLGERLYYDGGGSSTGLTESEYDAGIGRIDIDGGYDTTYTRFLEDCNEREIEAITDSNYWNKEELLNSLTDEV